MATCLPTYQQQTLTVLKCISLCPDFNIFPNSILAEVTLVQVLLPLTKQPLHQEAWHHICKQFKKIPEDVLLLP